MPARLPAGLPTTHLLLLMTAAVRFCSIGHQYIICNSHDKHNSNLRDKTGYTKAADLCHNLPRDSKAILIQLDALKLPDICKIQKSIQYLPRNRCPCCSFYAPMEYKNKNRIKDDVGNTSHKQSCHAVFRAAIRTDHPRHTRINGRKQNPIGNNPSIIHCIRQDIFCRAK